MHWKEGGLSVLCSVQPLQDAYNTTVVPIWPHGAKTHQQAENVKLQQKTLLASSTGARFLVQH